MIVRVVTHPTVEPVQLSQAKLHCKIDQSAEDDLLVEMIRTARMEAEAITARALITQTLEFVMDCFPPLGFELPRGKAQSITSVTYVDDQGVMQTLTGSGYLLDDASDPSWLFPAFDTCWPTTRAIPNAVRVRYVAGYGDTGEYVPEPITQWMKLRIGAFDKFREAWSEGKPIERNAFVDGLLDPYRLVRFC